jgi:peptide deformylase|tara:strand:- start:94 stop:603 length:510 start_codon:yes stop_codon:yes gene_type:complete
MVYVLIEKNHPSMNWKLDDVSPDCDREQLAIDLADTMRENNGIGLSANQVGVLERVFVMYSDVKEKKIITCFNPQIVEESTEHAFGDEGCLTYPGLWLQIKRPVWIKAIWEDQNGVSGEYKLAGLEARIFQHEYDHMEGTNFMSRVSKLRLQRAQKRVQKQLKRASHTS